MAKVNHALGYSAGHRSEKKNMPVPVIDLFAGPGGLGEGFSRAPSLQFDIAVSIEKDGMAFETLQLRAAHRALMRSNASAETWLQWDTIIMSAPWNIVFDVLHSSGNSAIEAACRAARKEAWNLELGPHNRDLVSEGIRQRLRPFMRGNDFPDNAVLIGGPPCQAYSIVGRSRNRGTIGYKAENDHRHYLYKEYLHVISEFRPAVFIMENVKGILSSRVEDRQIFDSISADLQRPDIACGDDVGLSYVLIALPVGQSQGTVLPSPDSFIVESETFGVPQARHRVIICGVRADVFARAGAVRPLAMQTPPKVNDVIRDLPKLRPELSHRGKGLEWHQSFDLPLMQRAVRELLSSRIPECAQIAAKMQEVRGRLPGRDPGRGADRLSLDMQDVREPKGLPHWYRDRPLATLANHESRTHMPEDLVRYLFVSSFGRVTKRSPRLSDFPPSLLPEHKNVDKENPGEAIFKDRFRVQLAHTFSMTVTSHIAKDGHAFIHPDPLQCRSLTVREAARLQTFPDSYVFLGTRTSQYTQVGNAVPPYLAVQIAEVVAEILSRAKVCA